MSSFHFCLSAARNLSSFQLLPTSLMTDLLQLFLGLPLFLLPWGFHSRAAFGISPSSFLSVWPIQLIFLILISKFISSWPVTLHKFSSEMTFGHHIAQIFNNNSNNNNYNYYYYYYYYYYDKLHCSFRNIGCLWVLSTSVYQLPETLVHSSFYPLLWWPIFSSYS